MSSSDNVTLIASEEALASFRQGLSGKHALDLLAQAEGRLLVQLPVGVGKTDWLAKIIEEASTPTSKHDLILVLVPRWDILQELVERLAADLPRTILHPRPRQRCGDLDAAWTQYETVGCSLLAKQELCRACPHRPECSWPDQYANLQGVRLILGTQQRLALEPRFVGRITHLTHARNPLVLLDESDFLVRSVERTIRAVDLEHFITAQQAAIDAEMKPKQAAQRWLAASQGIAAAATIDLRQSGWSIPFPTPAWAVKVQRAGRDLFGAGFRFPAYDLRQLVYHSDVHSRERLGNGDLRFATPLQLGDQFIIFSGSATKELVRYRLDPNHARPSLSSPFENHHFEHPETRWYNVNSLEGTAKLFPANADRIFDFFTAKILANIATGKRTLLVARKKFLPLCRTRLLEQFRARGESGIQIVTDDWKSHDLENPRVLPLINYGISGLNRFQHCEAAYCLTGYYISASTLATAVQDVDPTEDHYPITLDFIGRPRERRVRVHLPDDRCTILPVIARDTLAQMEADVVVQAVGRVRPFTRAREIITYQAGSLPGVRYTQQLSSLTEARHFFGVSTAKQMEIAEATAQAIYLRAGGRTIAQIAAELKLGSTTIKRYLRGGGPKTLLDRYV